MVVDDEELTSGLAVMVVDDEELMSVLAVMVVDDEELTSGLAVMVVVGEELMSGLAVMVVVDGETSFVLKKLVDALIVLSVVWDDTSKAVRATRATKTESFQKPPIKK